MSCCAHFAARWPQNGRKKGIERNDKNEPGTEKNDNAKSAFHDSCTGHAAEPDVHVSVHDGNERDRSEQLGTK